LLILYSTSFAILSSVDALEDLDIMSKKELKRWRINESAVDTSVRSTILLTSARDAKTYLCWVLYAFDGSASAGRIEVMKKVKIS